MIDDVFFCKCKNGSLLYKSVTIDKKIAEFRKDTVFVSTFHLNVSSTITNISLSDGKMYYRRVISNMRFV